MCRFSGLISSAGGALLIVLMSSCRSTGVVESTPVDSSGPVDQSIVFMIHGDADYLFHGTDGTAFIADKEAMGKAFRVATRNPTAEVFIFHERPLKRRLFLFPRDDGTFYYFRGGELLVEQTYRRGQGASRLGPVVTYYHRYRSRHHVPPVRMLVYMGHEVPEMDNIRYDASLRNGVFSMDHFAGAMGALTDSAAPFDLLVLSTCHGGTPHGIRSMAPFAHTIIAAPGDLHLSHLDVEMLERLDLRFVPKDDHPADAVPELARDLARASFDRLTEDLQTGVTIAVYDVDRVSAYGDLVAAPYDSTLASLQAVAPARREHVDCAELERFALPGISEGVDVFYRAPRFGRRADKSSHSGWQCWKEVTR